jgi:hypothetical protein
MEWNGSTFDSSNASNHQCDKEMKACEAVEDLATKGHQPRIYGL